jgi:hypothetical protein
MSKQQERPTPQDQRGRKRQVPAYARPENFFSILSENKLMYTPTRTLCEPSAVQKQMGGEAALLVTRDKCCSNLTWAPGLPMVIKDKAIIAGALRDHPGNNLFNLYFPADPASGDASKAGPWLDLGEFLWGDDVEHLLDWFAFKVQFPGIKINHSIVLGSYAHGVGKDSWLMPIKRAVGRWNWQNISARKAFNDAANFNAFLRNSVVLISELHDLGDKRFAFYDVAKDWGAAPPETLTIADKHVKAHQILNVVGVIYTTNHKADGPFLPPEDRRHFVAWSPRTPQEFPQTFWPWLKTPGNDEHVAAYLATRDLSKFDPFAPPPKTDAWHAIVSANQEPQDAELLDVLDQMGENWIFDAVPSRPDAVTVAQIKLHPHCPLGLHDFFNDVKNRRAIPHRLERAGYVAVPNRNGPADRLWRVNGVRQVIYARAEMGQAEQQDAAASLIRWEAMLADVHRAKTEAEQAAEDFAGAMQ